MTTCPLCNGAGKKIVVTRHSQSNAPKTAIEWCLCMKSRFISESVSNKPLAWLKDIYLPIEEIDPQLDFDPINLQKNPNLLIKATDFETFCLHVKSVLIKHRFQEPIPSIHFCRAIDILHDFYVQQEDGTSPHLSETDKFDLLITSLDTEEKNDKLKTCVAQIVYSRKCHHKTTWVYLPRPTLSACTQEYSTELDELLKSYEVVTLISKHIEFRESITKSKEAAANFMR